ncbi:biotin--[acetyl-CoA-carboxylase] ligase [Desulfobacca acetoxidans]|uniref:Bifunctional ligase/repressor BirA n=1 Tax=Desulfobacca acetoxidans (strain ATCC 700848 / DSM 11109 / ASRB2) TaxID=880072 RepID=F2NE45_DESAR|nr:biotin--[acetyl-CoA-carboxylase] ligase [Desulfobacca acetoxidans]AEB10675.1 biotin/acetyl-CoA-carboxylase ligase [Desulfobacca acetoxidans DSM 11109]
MTERIASNVLELDQVQQDLLIALKKTVAFLSGEQLGLQLGLSRTAVWKRIERLRGWGYRVEGSSRRGYRLDPEQDLLLPVEIAQNLPHRFLRGPVWHFMNLPSTNDMAKDLARQGNPEGSIIVAESQSAGRGRMGRIWESPPGGGIYLSLILRPPLPPAELPRLTLTAAVAVIQAIREVAGLAADIKWPNDILLQGKKLGGILTEMETESDQMSHVILGLGLNVNTTVFPEPVRRLATSLASAGKRYSRLAILRSLLAALDSLYGRFLQEEFPAILDLWRQSAVTLGQQVTVRQGKEIISGLALDVDSDGALLLQQPDGRIEKVISGEIANGPPNPRGREAG